jgi:phosphoglycolate phosphatase
MKPPIAVFDLDGTLVHTAPDLVGSLNHALAAHGHLAADYAAIAPFAGTGGRGMLKEISGLRGLNLAEAEILKIITTFLEHYHASMPGQSAVYDGALQFVSSLRSAGFKTAICTNKPQKLADRLLAKLEIAHHFDAVCGADYFSFRKPDPQHLTGTINVAGGNQSRAIMFGDSQTDFDTATAAAIPVVGVTFGYSPQPISDFKLAASISHYNEINVAMVTRLINS